MNKKIALITVLFLILFAGIITFTQESGNSITAVSRNSNFSGGWIKPPVWFRSNAGGMALEEIQTRNAALRYEYALEVMFAPDSEIPVYLTQFYDENYLPEIRVLYNNGDIIRTQWILKDVNSVTRMNAVFIERKAGNENVINRYANFEGKTGFIEIFNRDSLLISEYRFFEDGSLNRIENEFNENLLISSVVSRSEKSGDFKKIYSDFYRYNRSLHLRSVERIFYNDMNESDSIFNNFPRNLKDAVKETSFVSARINVYPEFFGNTAVEVPRGGSVDLNVIDEISDSASGIVFENGIIYDTDDRGRILKETLYNEDGKIVWVIQNTWQNNRIISSMMTEDGNEFLAEYEYNSDGDKLMEKNYKNGSLERIVRVSGNQEIEELYINNVIVLTAVWENGRKISESRVR